eukprot:4184760-Pyramimonas_sp.AAC.1
MPSLRAVEGGARVAPRSAAAGHPSIAASEPHGHSPGRRAHVDGAVLIELSRILGGARHRRRRRRSCRRGPRRP